MPYPSFGTDFQSLIVIKLEKAYGLKKVAKSIGFFLYVKTISSTLSH